MDNLTRRRAMLWLGFGLLAVVALGVRLPGIGEPTITHPEFYTPGIEFPAYVSNPLPRVKFFDVIRSVYAPSDIHPPGFYFVSWVWTKFFGTGEVSIRLLPALIGTATILMLFLLGMRTSLPWVAFGAAYMLALHGWHINKSVQSELWIWPTFYGVGSVLLLLAYLDRPGAGRWFAYVGVLMLGFWTEYSFWIFAAAQMAYIGLQAGTRPRFRPLLEAQALAAVLSFPVLIHLGNDLRHMKWGYLGSQPLPEFLRAMRFGGLVEPSLAERLVGDGTASTALLLGVAALGGTLLLLGLRVRSQDGPDVAGPFVVPAWVGPAVALVSCGLIVMYGLVLALRWEIPAALMILACGVVFAVRPVLRRLWPLLSLTAELAGRIPGVAGFLRDPVACHAVLPLAAFLIVGSVANILAARVMMITTPFLLLVMLRGLGGLAVGRGKPVAAAIGAVLLALSIASAADERAATRSTRDYKAVAAGLEKRIQPGDLIVVQYAWYSAPLHYYLTQDRFNFIRAADLTEKLTPAIRRVWVIMFGAPGDARERKFARFRERLGKVVAFDSFTERGAEVRGYRRILQ